MTLSDDESISQFLTEKLTLRSSERATTNIYSIVFQ